MDRVEEIKNHLSSEFELLFTKYIGIKNTYLLRHEIQIAAEHVMHRELEKLSIPLIDKFDISVSTCPKTGALTFICKEKKQ